MPVQEVVDKVLAAERTLQTAIALRDKLAGVLADDPAAVIDDGRALLAVGRLGRRRLGLDPVQALRVARGQLAAQWGTAGHCG